MKFLDENETNQFTHEDHRTYKTSDGRTLFHLVCESGVYKFTNNCRNILSKIDFNLLLSNFDESPFLPIELAEKNRLKNKHDVFIYLNELEDRKTLFHRLVIENRMIALRLILEYASDNAFIDTIGFGLKNNENKTCFELAVELKNSEAIYLINHYELLDKSLNSNKYPSIIEPSFSIIKDKIEYFMKLDEKLIYEPNIINNLIFQGGGVKGIAYVDALKESVKNRIFNLNNIKRVGGTSAGAITAVLLGVGYNLVEIEELLKKFKFESLLDTDPKGKKHFLALVKSFKSLDIVAVITKVLFLNWKCENKDFDDIKIGFFSGADFLDWIEERIFKKLHIKHATFKDLQLQINKNLDKIISFEKIAELGKIQKLNILNEFKSIFLTGSNLTTGKIEIFSHLHSPNMIISDAVRISMCIPIFFHPHQYYIKIKNTDNIAEKGKEPEEYLRIVDPNKEYILCEEEDKDNKIVKKVVKKNILYVDGGLLYNYPINMFDSKRIIDNIESNYINNQTLGFRLVSKSSKDEYESNLCEKLEEPKEEKNLNKKEKNTKLEELLKSLVYFYYKSEDRLHSERFKDQERTIYIDSKEIDGFDFTIKEADINKLRNSGKEAISDFLNREHNRNSNIYFINSLFKK